MRQSKMLDKKAEAQIKKIISKHLDLRKYKVFIFGSRVEKGARKFSDYDVGILGEKAAPSRKLALIEDELEESNLVYKVDVVDFAAVDNNFRKVAMKKIRKI